MMMMMMMIMMLGKTHGSDANDVEWQESDYDDMMIKKKTTTVTLLIQSNRQWWPCQMIVTDNKDNHVKSYRRSFVTLDNKKETCSVL